MLKAVLRKDPGADPQRLRKLRDHVIAAAARRDAAAAQRSLGGRERVDRDRTGADERQARNRDLGEARRERVSCEELDRTAIERDHYAAVARARRTIRETGEPRRGL